ncbi:hypothetical protein SSYM_0113, partial [Serratia symbiotica str. Tucson]
MGDPSQAIRKNVNRRYGTLLNRESVKKRINYVHPVNKRSSSLNIPKQGKDYEKKYAYGNRIITR